MPGERTCPSCEATLAPGDSFCTACGADAGEREALDRLAARITTIDTEVTHLMTQREALVAEYEERRRALVGRMAAPAPPVPAERREWSGDRVRALLLWLGAALLALSALTFTAVAWSRLGDGGRALLLVGATTLFAALAFGLRRRLPMTAEAFAGLAIVLMLIDWYAARRAGIAADLSGEVWWAIGTAVVAGLAAALGQVVGRRSAWFAVAALLPITPELLAAHIAGTEWAAAMALGVLAAAIVAAQSRLARHIHPEGQVVLGLHATGAWIAAAVFAGIAATQPDTIGGALVPALAVALLGAAPELARRALAPHHLDGPFGVLAHAVPIGASLALVAPLFGIEGELTWVVVASSLTVGTAALLPRPHDRWAVIAGAVFAVPGTLFAIAVSGPAVFGPLTWLDRPWSASLDLLARDVFSGPDTPTPLDGSWAAVWALGAIACAGVALGARRRQLLGITTAAIALVAALGPVTAGASVLVALVCTTTAFVCALVASAAADRERARAGWALLPGALIAAIPTIGWSAMSSTASVVTLAVATGAAVAATVIARSPAARATYAALAAVLGVALTGIATAAAGTSPAAAGFAAALAAGVVVLASVHLLRDEPARGITLEATGAAAAFVSALVAASSTPWLAGALTALVPIALGAALRRDRRVAYGAAAGALALFATWAWLAAAGVGVVEAYTAPAAALALAAGVAGWRTGPGRSWLALGPALVLAIGPTLALGIAEGDVLRLVLAAALAFATVVTGAVWRLQAPLCIGAAALLALGIDQWGDDIVRLPRWITLGVVGVLLMWIGATFEHRRRDWRRASHMIGHFG